MKIHKYTVVIALLTLGVLSSCRKRDDNRVQIREMSEVIPENDRDIQAYLRTHFCELDAQKNFVLDTLSGANAGKTSLWDNPNLMRKVLRVPDQHGNYIDNTMYYLILQEGAGEQATIADMSFVLYKGLTLRGRVFDDALVIRNRNWLDLLGTRGSAYTGGTIVGFREAIATLKASSIATGVENPDGTLSAPTDGGKGIFFMPSGIAYFTGSTGIPAYTPLIFQINLIKTSKADHDNDGIPSINEIVHSPDGTITFPDCNGNGRPDYLDALPCR